MSEKTAGGLLIPTESDVREFLEMTKTVAPPADFPIPCAVAGALVVASGFLSPYFITDAGRGLCEFENALVHAAARPITAPQDLVGVLECVILADRPALIVACEVSTEALALLAINKLRGILRVCAIAVKDSGPIVRYAGCPTPPSGTFAIADFGFAKRVICGATAAVLEA